MKRRGMFLTVAVAMVLVMSGCAKDPLQNMTQEESRIYITNHDENAAFSSYSTFSISDSVAVNNNGQTTRAQTAVDVSFINAIKATMVARGFKLSEWECKTRFSY